MSKKLEKLFAFILAIALVITTFGSDFASAVAYAAEDNGENATNSESIWEDVSNEDEGPVIIDTQELGTEDSFNEDQNTSEDEQSDVAIDENSSDISNEGSVAYDASSDAAATENTITGDDESASEDASTAGSSDEDAATDASSEESSEDASALLSSEVVEEIELEFNQSEEIDGIKVSLYAKEGVLPADAKLEITKVESEVEEKIADVIDEEIGKDKDVIKTFSYDINIYSKSEGKYVQPEDGTVSVKFEKIEEAADTSKTLAVFHVEDDLSDATKVATAYSDATEVSFEAEHFSIYTVTLFEDHWNDRNDKSYVAKISVVDEKGKDITEGKNITVNLDRYGQSNTYYVYVSDMAYTVCDKVNNQRFALTSATCRGQEFDLFYKPADENKIQLFNGNTFVANLEDLGEGDIVFTYAHTTYHHLDLGFMDPDEYSFYVKNAYITATVNNHTYTMYKTDQDSDIKSYEFRADLNGAQVLSTDEVTFNIYYGQQTFTYTTTAEDNYTAAVLCYDSHKHRNQNVYGFDYVLSFGSDFQLKGDVVYHKNDGTEAKWADTVNWKWSETTNTKSYKVLTIDEVAKKGDAPANFNKVDKKKFAGWKLADGTAVNGNITITKGQTIDLYAAWEDDQPAVYFYVLLPNKKVPASSAGQPKADYYPVEGNNYYSWAGTAIDLKDASLNPYRDSLGNIFDVTGMKVRKANYTAPVTTINTDLANSAYFKNVVMMDGSKPTADDIVWYVYKQAETTKYHIDGYIRGAKITVTYHANYTDAPANVSEYAASGNNYTVKEYGRVFGDRPGYKFLGWNSQADGKGTSYKELATVFLMAGCDFYAQWEAVDYTTTYVDEDGQTLLGQQTQKYGDTTYTLPADPTKKDHVFTGWVKVGDETQTKVTTDAIKQTTVEGNVTYRATYAQNIYEAYYNVEYYYQDKEGKNFVKDAKSTRKLIPVSIDTLVNEGKVEVSVSEDDKKRTTYNNYTYVLDPTDTTWTGYVTKDNTKQNPLVLKVYYLREHTGIQMVLTAGSATKYYDGTPLNNDEITVSVVDKDGKDLSANYKVTYTKTSGGEENANDAATENIIIGFKVENTVNGEVYYYNTTASGNAKKVEFKKGSNVCEIKDDKFEVSKITIKRGSLKVLPRPITINVPGASKTYDGKAYDAATYTGTVTYSFYYTEEEQAVGKTLSNITLEGTKVTIPTDVVTVNKSKESTTEIALSDSYYFKVNGKTLKEKYKKRNFVITINNGDLVINPAEVRLESKDLEKEFDGTNLVNGEEPLKVEEGFAEGEGATYEFTGAQLDPGSSPNSFRYVPKNGTDFSNYVFEKEDGTSLVKFGTLTVNKPTQPWKIVVTFQADAEGNGADTYVKYSGASQTANLNVTVHIVTNEESKEVPDVPEEDTTPGDEGRAFGYNFINGMKSMAGSLAAGFMDLRSFFVLTAQAAEKEITETVTVNGTEFTLTGLKVTGGEGTDVGDYPINLDYTNLKITTPDGEVTTDILDKSTDPIGYLHVLEREITITSASDSKTDDGSPLTNHNYTLSGEEFVEGEGVDITFTGSQSGVGSSANSFTYAAKEGTKLSNYKITPVFGTLTINGTGGGNPPSGPSNPPSTSTVDTPAPAQAVLGARREEPVAANGQAVLGARRGGTADETNTVRRILAILVAAGIVGTVLLTGKRKNLKKNNTK
ncbi:InlB B-repeat-containing protein [Butyrivibrio proteoclasticus]|uniref:InlB B-repeat-containing protein n=1 Tax=Butyrivibrio proteoclasticus TaxID=43305 RepID=UPI00047A1361|nr:InlB B-repeat-containing protein [Butyrivibrio proteoclasticus]